MIDKDETSFVVDALHSIRPNSEFIVGESYASLDWHSTDQDKPTEKEFNDAVTAYKTEYSNNEYVRNRKLDYPEIGDQLDALYHAGVFPANMAARIKETKDKYPK